MPCKYCHKPIPEERQRRHAKFCSNRCSQLFQHAKYKILNEYTGLPTGTVGAMNELKVSIDLLRKGYEVFRALSPACSCDLAILKKNKLLRIEVKTGFFTPNKKINFPKNIKADSVALVIKDKIYYNPPFPD